jgi:hypothetical protein
MADWRLAIEKVLKSEKPRKFRRSAVVQGTDHRQVVQDKGEFPADELTGINPGSTRINSPAETRVDTGVPEGGQIDPFFPVSPGASIKADSKTFSPTYSRSHIYVDPAIGELSHFHFSTHREEPDKREKIGTGPADDDPAAWLAWMQSRIAVWQARGLSGAEVSQIVWSEAESAWHLRHHPTADPNRCAGCGKLMLDAPGMSLPDGAVVHVGDPAQFDCLIAHGAQWRQTASDALMSLLEEQAAIAEFAGGLARAAAERQAWAEMIGKPDGAAR